MEDLIKQLAGNSTHIGYYKDLIFSVTKLIRMSDCTPENFNIIYDYLVQLAKDNNEIYVCLNPYDVDINGSKTLIMSNTDGGLDHIYNQCEMEI